MLLGAVRFQHQKAASISEELQQAQEDSAPESLETKVKNVSDEDVAKFFREHQIHVQGLQDPKIQKPILDFSQIQFPPKLQALMDQYKYSSPTPIQAQSLPILLSGRDLIGIAQTGSGKTLAFLLPAFKKFFSIHRDYFSSNRDEEYSEEKLSPPSKRLNPKVLVLAPTRELALQIFDVVRQFRMFKTVCLYGGSDRRKQVVFLENQTPLIVVSTPGRLKDLLDSNCLSLKEIEYLVVDEADRMLDMGFEPQISYLINQCPKERQTMMFSASWPDEVKSLVHRYLRPNHAFLSIGGTKLVANHNIEQHVTVCAPNERDQQLGEVLRNHPDERVLVFANTKAGCDRVARMVQRSTRTRAFPLHGDMTQNQRERTLQDFKSDRIKVLVATNVAARGLDIDDVSVVVNYDMPDDIETYVHRIGRTGRKQNKGHSYSFFIDNEKTTLAKKLVEIMEESRNEVPDELREIAQSSSYRDNYNTKYKKRNNNNNNFFSNNYNNNRNYGDNYNSRYGNKQNRYDRNGGGENSRFYGNRRY